MCHDIILIIIIVIVMPSTAKPEGQTQPSSSSREPSHTASLPVSLVPLHELAVVMETTNPVMSLNEPGPGRSLEGRERERESESEREGVERGRERRRRERRERKRDRGPHRFTNTYGRG